MKSSGFWRHGLASLLATALALAGCGEEPPPAPKAVASPAKPYAGQTLMVVAPKLRAGLISGPVVEQAKRFEERTGAKVRVIRPGWNETVERIRDSLDDPRIRYDVYLITTSWSGPLFERGVPAEVPAWVKQRVEWEDILPIYRDNLLSWNRVDYALPYDGDTVTLYYRKDLFDDEAVRARFRERHGRELAPPATWREFAEVGRFFNGWDWDGDGAPEYGAAGSRLVNTSSMLIYLSRAAAYAKHPDDPAYYFDPETLAPRIDSPGFVQALEEYVEALEYGPPGMINFSPADVRRRFIGGEVAMAIDWANIGIDAETSPASVVKGRVGYAPLPGAERVYAAAGGWEARSNSASSMVGNYLFLVDRRSPHLEAAFAFAAEMSSRELTTRLTVTPESGINPSRHSHIADPAGWRAHGFTTEAAGRYLGVLHDAISNPNHVFDIRIPGSARYYQSLDRALYRALHGEATPAQALAEAAREWEGITDGLGRERQRTLYRESLNLNGES